MKPISMLLMMVELFGQMVRHEFYFGFFASSSFSVGDRVLVVSMVGRNF
jgi:hypothetical protein